MNEDEKYGACAVGDRLTLLSNTTFNDSLPIPFFVPSNQHTRPLRHPYLPISGFLASICPINAISIIAKDPHILNQSPNLINPTPQYNNPNLHILCPSSLKHRQRPLQKSMYQKLLGEVEGDMLRLVG